MGDSSWKAITRERPSQGTAKAIAKDAAFLGPEPLEARAYLPDGGGSTWRWISARASVPFSPLHRFAVLWAPSVVTMTPSPCVGELRCPLRQFEGSKVTA